MGGSNSGSLVLIWILHLACQGTIITGKCLLSTGDIYASLIMATQSYARNIALKNEGYISSVIRFLFQERLYIWKSVT